MGTVTQKISRAQWAQIASRAQKVAFTFDPMWKCLIDGSDWRRGSCAHTVEDQTEILKKLAERSA